VAVEAAAVAKAEAGDGTVFRMKITANRRDSPANRAGKKSW
jgi:hypothetical protein